MDAEDWAEFDEDQMQVSPMTADSFGQDSNIDMPQGEPMPYESPEPVDFRGDFKPRPSSYS